MARARRILPGLSVAALVTAFILGPLLTTHPVSAYLLDRETLTYVPKVLSLIWMQYTLPGLFQHNPYSLVVNGPLWTLPIEVYCYAGLTFVGLLGFYRPRLFPLMLAASLPIYGVARYGDVSEAFTNLAILGFPFLLGMAAYFYRSNLPLDWRLMLALAAAAGLACWAEVLREEAATLAIGYATLWLAVVNFYFLRNYNRLGDYSYGIYIYGWPVQQTLISSLPGVSVFELMILGSLGALVCGIVSWHFLEKPALNWRRVMPRECGLSANGNHPAMSTSERAEASSTSAPG